SDDGTIQIAASKASAIEAAMKMINEIAAEPEVGEIYKGKVVKLMDFGAFVNFFGSKDGLVHISQLTNEMRPEHPSDVVKEGQEVFVKLLGFDDRGKTRLSMKIIDQETGQQIEGMEVDDIPPSRGGRGGRGGGGGGGRRRRED
ncbi:MAG: S1 RNA-binding domain-containing protein, partial [Pseudomonadota bacterium]